MFGSINAVLRPGPFVRASRTPFQATFYTEDTELPGPYHKEYVQAGGEVSPISDASSNREDPSSAWPVVTGQVNQDLEGDYPGTAAGVEEHGTGRNDPIPLPYLSNDDMAADWPPSASASDDSAQAGPSTFTSATTNASSLAFAVSSKDQEEVLLLVSEDTGNNDYDMATHWPPSTSMSDDSAQAGPSSFTSAATNASSLLCRVSSKVLEEILLGVSVDLRVSRGRAENRSKAQFSKRPRKFKTTKDGKLRRSARNRNGAASSTVSAGSSGHLKSRKPGPWRLRSSNPTQADLDGAETASLTS